MTPKPTSDEAKTGARSSGPQSKPRTVHSCNFRYAGRLSNENARALTALHEKFAVNVATSLELYLGTSLQLKLLSLEQMAIQDYVAGMKSNNYVVPCTPNVTESMLLVEMDISLIFPIIDLLLGGTGEASEQTRELTEIDEEIMQSVTVLVVKQMERSWRALDLLLTPGRCTKPGMIQQIFQVNEKLVLLMFEMTIGGTTGPFNIVLPAPFVGSLLRHLKTAQAKKTSSLRPPPSPTLRERILECDFTVAADMTQMRVLVKDLIALKPGMVLKMKAPVNKPGRLTVENVEIFEAGPVRNGSRKAAQLSCRMQEPAPTKEWYDDVPDSRNKSTVLLEHAL
jgi:flagellar motor switch protein FliM